MKSHFPTICNGTLRSRCDSARAEKLLKMFVTNLVLARQRTKEAEVCVLKS